MKKLLAWFQAIPVIFLLGGGLWVYTWYVKHEAIAAKEREALIVGVIETFRALNVQHSDLEKQLSAHRKVVVRYVALADTAKAKQDSILTEHPIATAPKACAPWVAALLSCQIEAASLRLALDTTTADLDSAHALLARDTVAMAEGTKALKAARCRFPCLTFAVIAGAGLGDDLKLHKGVFAGLKLH